MDQGEKYMGQRANSPWKGPKEPRKMAENMYSRATQLRPQDRPRKQIASL